MSATRPKSANDASKNNYFESSPHNRNTSRERVSNGGSSSSPNKVLESKNSRKRAEADLQLLSNRIQLLKLEEQRALQRVQETKVRAKEILDIKKRTENVVQSRIMVNVSREMETKAVQERAAAERDARKQKLHITKQSLVENRRQIAVRLREEQKQHELQAVEGKVSIVEVNKQKAYEERKRRESIKLKQERERKIREDALQIALQRKVEEEDKKKQDAERIISELEQEERALIERLKKTQEMQEKAIANLQKSLEL